jgi:hypothetical protein
VCEHAIQERVLMGDGSIRSEYIRSMDISVESVALTLAVVASLRKRIPKLDGVYSVLLTLVVSLAISYAGTSATLPVWAEPMRQGLLVAILAIGGMDTATYLAGKATNGNGSGREA